MTKDMSAITTAPEGFEFTGDVRPPQDMEWYAVWGNGRWESENAGETSFKTVYLPILSKIQPPVIAYDVTVRLKPESFKQYRYMYGDYRNAVVNVSDTLAVIRDAIQAGHYVEVRE